ncbi:putative glutaredoxin-C14 [Panicum miliaceum]|uniref:Glutaredoxin-C14 n=1 Tax=Panicum miliaceum TaxID=4540 RepID=A0A3L6T5E9_PANMI|nr:putative glutaredoxin-C14 [Panicum miliaceum]
MADRVMKLVSERAVVVFTLSSCCMCHTVTKLLIQELSVNALVHELDSDPRGKEMERALLKMLGGRGPAVPAVFIGGKLVGGTNRVMSLHLGGELVPMLMDAGALWV